MVAASLVAQGYLTGAALNKKIVMDFYRVGFEPRNVDLLEQYIALDFVEHNPTVESRKSGGDRAALAAFIKTLPKPAIDDIGSEMKSPPAYVVAEGDMVTFISSSKSPAQSGLIRYSGPFRGLTAIALIFDTGAYEPACSHWDHCGL